MRVKTNKKKPLTLAVVFVVSADLLSVVDQRSFGVQISAGPVRQRFVVQMKHLAIVHRARRRSFVDERPAQEFVLDLARQPTRRLAGHLCHRNAKMIMGEYTQLFFKSIFRISPHVPWGNYYYNYNDNTIILFIQFFTQTHLNRNQ